MEQNNKKIISVIIIIALIIAAGIITVYKWGFNKELRYSESKRIDIYVEQKVDENLIKNISSEVLGMHNMVQVVEVYEEMVTIRAPYISEEQRNTLVNKIKDNYEFEQTAENTDIIDAPLTRIRDMYMPYVVPGIVAFVLVTAYVTIINYKKGIMRVLAQTVITSIAAELVLLSWMAIVRIEIGRITPILMLLVYILNIYYVMKSLNTVEE